MKETNQCWQIGKYCVYFRSLEKGWWTTSGKPISVVSQSGIATAVAVGSTMVFYNEEDFNTYTEVCSPLFSPLCVFAQYIANNLIGLKLRHGLEDSALLFIIYCVFIG